ncbi:MAG: CocE/NonD family hydrolase [Bacteroidales bacterium]
MKKNQLHKIGILFLALLLWGSQSFSQSIFGKWWGLVKSPNNEFRLVLQVDKEGDIFKARLFSPDRSPDPIIPASFNFNFPDLKFELSTRNTKYEGNVDAKYSKISGIYSQTGYSVSLNFTRDSIPPSQTSIVSIQNKYTKTEVYITMRDGVKLFTSFYIPKDSTKTYPMLMFRTPYNIEPGGEKNFNYFLSGYYRYVKENYILVFQDVRGRYMSEGEFEDIRPYNPNKKTNKDIDEASDTYDAVDWLIKNVPYNNGKVGVTGVSYPGFYSTMAILSGHPAIKAVSPQAPVTAWFMGDDFHHNGAMFLLDCFTFYSSFGKPRNGLSRTGPSGYRWKVQDNYQFFLEQGSLSSIKKKFFADTLKFWNDAFAHPNYDEFWKTRDPQQHLKNIKPAVMTVGGWFDAEDLYGALHIYGSIEKQNPSTHPNYLVMGPWSHGQWSSGKSEKLGNISWGQDANKSYQELEVKFFDYYLQDIGDAGFDEATIFITGENQWKTFKTWPPINVEEKKLYFQPNRKLSLSAPVETSAFDEYMTDPNKPVPYSEKVHQRRTREYMTDDQRFASKRPDVMVYQTDVLTEDMTFVGPLNAQLFVSTTGTDADYVVKLIDVFPEDFKADPDQKIEIPMGGYQMLVRGEVMRGKYRNSFEKPEAFIPNKITEVKFEMPDIAHTFKKGHRIMVQVQNSWFPLVDRNPQKFVDIYKCTEADFQKAMQRIYFDKKNSSNIKVNVLK